MSEQPLAMGAVGKPSVLHQVLVALSVAFSVFHSGSSVFLGHVMTLGSHSHSFCLYVRTRTRSLFDRVSLMTSGIHQTTRTVRESFK